MAVLVTDGPHSHASAQEAGIQAICMLDSVSPLSSSPSDASPHLYPRHGDRGPPSYREREITACRPHVHQRLWKKAAERAGRQARTRTRSLQRSKRCFFIRVLFDPILQHIPTQMKATCRTLRIQMGCQEEGLRVVSAGRPPRPGFATRSHTCKVRGEESGNAEEKPRRSFPAQPHVPRSRVTSCGTERHHGGSLHTNGM